MDRDTAELIDSHLSDAQASLTLAIRTAHEENDYRTSAALSRVERALHLERLAFRKENKLAERPR